MKESFRYLKLLMATTFFSILCQSALALPDLRVTNIFAAGGTTAGATSTFKVVVTNFGNTAKTEGSVLRVPVSIKLANGTVQGIAYAQTTERINPASKVVLEANNAFGNSSSFTVPNNTYTAKAIADNLNRINESNETNNIFEKEFIVSSVSPVVTGVKAVRADEFIEFIGINAHVNYLDTVYGTRWNEWRNLIGELGVRYLRSTGNNSTTAARFNWLYDNHGIKSLLIFNAKYDGVHLDNSAIAPLLNHIQTEIGVNKILGVEGANEYNAHPETKPNWVNELRSHQMTLWNQTRSRPAFNEVDVVGPSVWRRVLEDHNKIGDLSAYADNGALHYYSGAYEPTTWWLDGDSFNISEAIRRTQLNVRNKKVYVTEMGYTNNHNDGRVEVPFWLGAKYGLREIADFFMQRDKVEKVFVFNLIDLASRGKWFGVLNENLGKKPIFYAIKNMIKILTDNSNNAKTFSTGRLNYSFSGNMDNIQHFITQKANGRFYMVIWQDVRSYNASNTSPGPINVPDRAINLNVSSHGFSRANFYKPTALNLSGANKDQGVNSVSTQANPSVISLDVPDEILVIELIP